jgi:hypothetical protein
MGSDYEFRQWQRKKYGDTRKSLYYLRHSTCPRKLQWYADNFDDSLDNWIGDWEQFQKEKKRKYGNQ